MDESKAVESKLNRIKVNICGEEYSIRTDADPRYVQRIATKVDKGLAELSQQFPNVPRERLAVLLALNLTEKLEQRAVRQARAEKRSVQSAAAEDAATAETTVRVATSSGMDPESGDRGGLFGTPLE